MRDFSFQETMRGTYREGSSAPRPIEFSITARVPDALQPRKAPVALIEGDVTAEGFATRRALTGSLELGVLFYKRMVYEFEFTDDEGRLCRFMGRKNVRALNLTKTMTELSGTIEREGVVFASADLKFDARNDLLPFVLSFRLR